MMNKLNSQQTKRSEHSLGYRSSKILGSNRSQEGMSLASVLAMSVVITLFVTALLSTVMPVFQKAAGLRHATSVRSMAEVGLDYAVQQLNVSPGAYISMGLGTSSNISVPASLISPGAAVTVQISNPGNPPGGVGNANPSTLFDPLLNVTNPNSFRMATVTATYGNTTRRVRALLQPVFATSGAQFPYALFGISSTIFAGQAGLNTYNAPASWTGNLAWRKQIAAHGGTLGKISQIGQTGALGLTRGIAQGGNHYEYPNPTSYYNQQFNIAGINYDASQAAMGTANWTQMYGNVYSNGANTAYVDGPAYEKSLGAFPQNVFGSTNGREADGIIPTGSSKSSGHDQYINPDSKNAWKAPTTAPTHQAAPNWKSSGGGGLNAWNPEPTLQAGGVTYPQPVLSGADVAPAGTTNLGSINLKNGAKLIFDSSKAAATGPIGTVNGGEVRIAPGQYKITSLTLSGASSIEFTSGTQDAIASGSANPAKLYLDSPGSSAAVSVSNDSKINVNSGLGSTGSSTFTDGATGLNTTGSNGLTYSSSNKSGQAVSGGSQLALNHPTTANNSNIVETKGASSNFQIHSNAQTNIILSGNERMTIYAPYADVIIGSVLTDNQPEALTKGNANFYGAAVGQHLVVQSSYANGGGAYVHYDYNLMPNNVNGPYLDPFAAVPPKNPGAQIGYRVVSWQEAVNPNPGNPSLEKWHY